MSYQPRRPIQPVENYTRAFLWMAGVTLFTGLVLLWVAYGYATALAAAGAFWLGLDYISRKT